MSTATKTQRRKYRFADRATAEAEYCKADNERIDQLRLGRAIYKGRIDWGKIRKPYRFGVFDRQSCGGPRIVLVFDPGGQEPALDVIDPWGNELRDLEEMALRYPAEAESRALLEGIGEIRKIMGPLS